MNCEDISTILDERREPRLTPAQRCAVEEHLAACADCASAWHAETALAALATPLVPADLLARVLAAVATPPRRRRTSRLAFGAALLAAGAALAAVTFVSLSERNAGDAAGSEGRAPPGPAPTDQSDPDANGPTLDAENAANLDDERTDAADAPDSDYFLVSRTAPDYPPAALKKKLEGHAQIKFTVAKDGSVADIEVVDTTDPSFGASAAAAMAKWRYLPRVVDGERVPVRDQQTIIRFQLAPDEPAKPPATSEPPPEFLRLKDMERRLDSAWKCASALELRCAELILDELVATHELTPDTSPQVWTFYGWIFTQYGDYGRAIAAYEQSVGHRGSWPGDWVALANLYFARNQYDMALKTLLRWKETESRIPALGSEELFEKLRRLGITEETL